MNLVLFFTRGVSLRTWASSGLLERESALYLRLQEKGVKVAFVTYDGADDLDYSGQLAGIEILCNRWNLPSRLYEALLPALHARTLRRAHVYKTNQTMGAEVALRAARIWQKPMVSRCGYMWSEFARREGTSFELERSKRIERTVFESAERVVVTTTAMKEYVEEKYTITPGKVAVIPNYVLTNLFSPGESKPNPNSICFVGRLNDQKNLHSLVWSCEGLDVELHVIGEGSLRSSIQEQAALSGVNLVLHGEISHQILPEMIRQSAVFALVSHYEGHPKALLEAMSCGVAVLAANSPGIREQIDHGKTGWLVRRDVESIRAGIGHLLENPSLREQLGENARRYVQENQSLERIVKMEYRLLSDLVQEGNL